MYLKGAKRVVCEGMRLFLILVKQQRALSSAGQSIRLITGWPQVQILQGSLANVPTLVSP